MKKLILLLLICTISIVANAQIKVDDVGDGWKLKVDSAIQLIGRTSIDAKNLLDSSTARVEFWLGDRSSTRPDPDRKRGTILLAVDEIGLGIENIAAVLVHESFHLHIYNLGYKLDPIDEERWAYTWELLFLTQVQNCPHWLILNAEYQINALRNRK